MSSQHPLNIEHIPHFADYDRLTGRLTLRGARVIPEEVFRFSDSIRILDITGCSVSALPEAFSSLDQLTAVFLWGNDFLEFPSILSACHRLRLISFKHGKLRHIPDDAFPPSLEWLVLTNNPDITHIPDSIGELEYLRKLALTGTGIATLPESLKECRDLEFLRLSACQFTHDFPSWIQDFPKLAWFAGAGNPCSLIPEPWDIRVYDPSEVIIDERINESPSSIVSRAHLRSTWQSVVVKRFKDSLTSDGYPIDDIRAALALGQHPNIVYTLGMIHSDKVLMLVSEPIPETYTKLWLPPSLESCTRDTYPWYTRYSLDFIEWVLRGIASACAHMHALGISHGDLYAHNILVNPSGDAILCDCGAATFYDRALHPEYERYDLRAFGHLIGELLERVKWEDLGDERGGKLPEIREKCLSVHWGSRYSFQNIEKILIL